MILHDRNDSSQLARSKAIIPGELDRLEPDLGVLLLTFNVHVWWLVAVA